MRDSNRAGLTLPKGALANRLGNADCEDSPPSASAGWTDIRLDTPTDYHANPKPPAGLAMVPQLPPLIEVTSPVKGEGGAHQTEPSHSTPIRGSPTTLELIKSDEEILSQCKPNNSNKSNSLIVPSSAEISLSLKSCHTPDDSSASNPNDKSLKSSDSSAHSLLVIRRSAPSLGMSHSAEGYLETTKGNLSRGEPQSLFCLPNETLGGEGCQIQLPKIDPSEGVSNDYSRRCTAHRLRKSPTTLDGAFNATNLAGSARINHTTTSSGVIAAPMLCGVGRWSPGGLRSSLNPFEDQLMTNTPHRHEQPAPRNLFWGMSPCPLPNEGDAVQENVTYVPEILRTSTVTGPAFQSVTMNNQNCPLFVKQSTATTATCQLISTPPPSRREREPKTMRRWDMDMCVKGEPLRILNATRLALVIPFCLYILLCSLRGSNWRYVRYHVSSEESNSIKSASVLSLSGIERVREIRRDGVASSHTLSELPLTFKRIRESGASDGDLFCDTAAHQKYIENAIGNLSSLTTFIQGSRSANREFRVAMYEAIYGPTYRDVDCRALRSFEVGGRWIKACSGVCIGLLIVEWCICLLYLVSKTREQEAIVAFQNARRLRRNNNENNGGNELDGRVEIYTYGRNDVEACGRTASSESRTNQNERSSCWILSRGCHWPEKIVGSGWSIPLWWKPLGWLQKHLHAQPRRGSRQFYYCISFLEGTTTVLALAELLSLSLSAIIWTVQTREPACLDGSVELRSCSFGGSYMLFILAIVCVAGSLYYHLINGRLLENFHNVKESRKERDMSRASIEVPVTAL